MPTTLQPKILLVTLKYDFKVMQRENSPNEVQKGYLRGTNFFGIQTVQMGYCPPKWGTVGNPAVASISNLSKLCSFVVFKTLYPMRKTRKWVISIFPIKNR